MPELASVLVGVPEQVFVNRVACFFVASNMLFKRARLQKYQKAGYILKSLIVSAGLSLTMDSFIRELGWL